MGAGMEKTCLQGVGLSIKSRDVCTHTQCLYPGLLATTHATQTQSPFREGCVPAHTCAEAHGHVCLRCTWSQPTQLHCLGLEPRLTLAL